jgi:hypothetical protein
MLEKFLAAEVLEVRVLHLAIAQSLVRKVVSVFCSRLLLSASSQLHRLRRW